MKTKVMVTGARAPVALEWVRCLSKVGVDVGVSDTHFGLACFSKHPESRRFYPSPRFEFERFREFWHRETSRWDFVIPTCEEVFYLAKAASLDGWSSKLLAPPLDLLVKLHSKAQFLKLWKGAGLKVPATEKFLAQNFRAESYSTASSLVFKPEYTRFASQVFLDPQDPKLLNELAKAPESSWLAQEKLKGTELCLTAWVANKKVVSRECYRPEFRIGLGASVRFKADPHHSFLDEALSQFVSHLPEFEGQIAFDVFVHEGRVLPIECNPRGTSGFHLMARDPVFVDLLGQRLTGSKFSTLAQTQDCCLWWVLFLQGPRQKFKAWLQALWNSGDVVCDWRDPFPMAGQVVATLRFLVSALFRKTTLLQATTNDIEYNGEDVLR